MNADKDGRGGAEQYTGYLAPEDLLPQLRAEIGKPYAVYDRLLVLRGRPKGAYWAQNIWHDARYLEIASIGDAAKKLRQIQRNWVLFSSAHHRRAALIQEQLPHVSAKPLEFPTPVPRSPLGAWTLAEPNKIFYAETTSSPFPNGEAQFAENKTEPPSRAYLKLWETFTRLGIYPQPGERCLDAGAAPGGWSWVLAELGAQVLAVDRSPLEGSALRHPRITFEKGDAFSQTPDRCGKFDWVLCDVACYPERLLEWVKLWIASGCAANMVCTLKFQGSSHYTVIPQFAAIPGSQLMHLFHNKHELTWVRLAI